MTLRLIIVESDRRMSLRSTPTIKLTGPDGNPTLILPQITATFLEKAGS
jgi:hypothetical protein